MYLEGNLQLVFDALYGLGIIEPLLKKNWREEFDERVMDLDNVSRVVETANNCQSSAEDLMGQLQFFDRKCLEYLAIEVAREFADFHQRKVVH